MLERVCSENAALSDVPFSKLEYEYRRLLEETHADVLAGLITLEEARTERFWRLFESYGVNISTDEAAAVTARGRKSYQESRRVVPGVRELLEALRPRVRIGIVTNNVTAEQVDKLKACSLNGLVDFLVVSEEVGDAKPARRIFEVALRRAGCRAEETVMVGDSWAADVLGAVGAGMRAVWLNRRGEPAPDPSIAVEIRGFEPVEVALEAIFGRGIERTIG